MAQRVQDSYKITLKWKGVKIDTGIGWGDSSTAAVADYFNSHGYGAGCLRVLDSWEAEKEEVKP